MENKGICYDMKNDFYILFIFMDDDESHWNETSISDFWHKNIESATAYLEKWANHYGHPIKIEKAYYATGVGNLNINYNGSVIADLFKENPGNQHMRQAMTCLGFEDLNSLHQYMKNFSKKEQIAYVVAFNKPGISFCTTDYEKVNGDYFKYCILFSTYPTCEEGVDTGLVHEILHLFGAEDYYDPYQKLPLRKVMAEKLCPNDIMLKTYTDIEYNEINEFTAYSVGWIDTLPAQYNHDDWWK